MFLLPIKITSFSFVNTGIYLEQKNTNTIQIQIAVQSIDMILFNASILFSLTKVKLVNPQNLLSGFFFRSFFA